jgi:hypothetical protein
MKDLLDFRSVDDRVREETPPSAVKSVRVAKLELIRVAREENLRKIFPAMIESGHSYHFLTAGDIDALSFLSVLLERYERFPKFYASTWTMSHADCRLIESYLEARRLGELNILTGEYFASRETSVYATLVGVISKFNGRLKKFMNHAKLICLADPARDLFIICEGSANFTTNPRTEQTTLTASKELFDFYAAWFERLYAGDAEHNL